MRTLIIGVVCISLGMLLGRSMFTGGDPGIMGYIRDCSGLLCIVLGAYEMKTGKKI